jgi:hypothetical protein
MVGCTTQTSKSDDRIKIVKQYDYRITIDIWNGFAGYQGKYILNNLRLATYDSSRDSDIEKPLTLYYISYTRKIDPNNPNIRTLVPLDTSEIPFSKVWSDTLYNLTHNFLKNVQFKIYDTLINGVVTRPVVFDDSKATIELNYGGKKLNATISSISNPTISNQELDTLLNFIGKFEPANKE